MSKIKINVLEDGPFIVDNLPKLLNSKGNEIEIDEKIALCRCGASSNKPFCDGSHKKDGFKGKRENNASLKKERAYVGKEITIHDNRTICCHAGECVSNLNAVFDINSNPWINPDNAAQDEVIDVIKKCPSGALSYTINDLQTRDFERSSEINISKNGPYNVVGNIEISVSDDLQPPSKDHYTLCRCGASKNKPYCDGSHSNINFVDEKN
ncbi:MAG: CDGSH iron-sulfur domain-containing protein [Thermodesulfobacteriota bacterium]